MSVWAPTPQPNSSKRFFGFQLGRRQWVGIILVAVSLALLGRTGKESGGDTSDYSLTALILFEGGGIALGLRLIFSHRIERVRAQQGVMLGAAAGLGFGISDVAIKALSDDLEAGLVGLISPWSVLVVVAARLIAFVLVLLAAAVMPAPVRAGEALQEPRGEPLGAAPTTA